MSDARVKDMDETRENADMRGASESRDDVRSDESEVAGLHVGKLAVGLVGAGLAIGTFVLVRRRRRWARAIAVARARDDDRRLDSALEESFPTSDPVSIQVG